MLPSKPPPRSSDCVWTQEWAQRRILLDEAVGACTEANNQNGGRIIHLPESLSL
jgi:hypothetical protein